MNTACINWSRYKDRAGYGTTFYRGKVRKAHRVAYCHANGIPIESIDHMVIRHTCDNPSCVNPLHLITGSLKDNNTDRMLRNRSFHPDGEKNHASKLTDKQIYEIRKKYIPRRNGRSTYALAKEYGVSPAWISRIVLGYAWRDESSKSMFLTFEGKTLSPSDWASDERVKVTARGIIERKKRGLSDFDALFAPKRTHKLCGGNEK
jgi:hypothetical protein